MEGNFLSAVTNGTRTRQIETFAATGTVVPINVTIPRTLYPISRSLFLVPFLRWSSNGSCRVVAAVVVVVIVAAVAVAVFGFFVGVHGLVGSTSFGSSTAASLTRDDPAARFGGFHGGSQSRYDDSPMLG